MQEEAPTAGKRSAVDLNSGQTVSPSVPGLEQPTPPLTSGRIPEACPPSSPLQPKKGPEVQEPGGFLGTRQASPSVRSEAEQAQVSSLVSNTNNRYTRRPEGRGKYCARHTLKGIDLRNPVADAPNVNRYSRLNCNCWDCSYCGPIKAKKYKAAIRRLAEAYRLNKFLTLTLDPAKLTEIDDPVRFLRRAFADFRVYLFRKFHQHGRNVNYITVLEFHLGGGENHGIPHLHILVDTYIEQAWISKAWQAVGGGHRVWIEQVSISSASRYLSKYLTKEMILSAPKRSRRITCSRSITLLPRMVGPKHYRWILRNRPIQEFFAMESQPDGEQFDLFQIVDVIFDREEFLQGFGVPVHGNYGTTTLTLGAHEHVSFTLFLMWKWIKEENRQEQQTIFHLRSVRNSAFHSPKTRNRKAARLIRGFGNSRNLLAHTLSGISPNHRHFQRDVRCESGTRKS